MKNLKGLEDDFDPVGHGTHIGGTIISMARGAKIYIGGVVDRKGNLNTGALTEALNHAVDEWDVDIISLSLGFPKIPSKELMDAINRALYKEKLIFAAVSNNGGAVARAISWPAMETKVFGIFSANFEGEGSKFNPDENDDDVFSRYKFLGETVKSTWLDNEEKYMTGTSVATSIATSTAALFLEYIRGYTKGGHGMTGAAICAIERAARRPDGMRRIFAEVGTKRQTNDFLRYVTPWYLLDQDKGRLIIHRIDQALIDLQLDNYHEEFQNLESSNSALEDSLSDREAQVQENQRSFDGGRDDLRIQVLAVLATAAIGSSSAHVFAPLLWWATGSISLAIVWTALAFAREKQETILNGYKSKATDLISKLQDSIRLNDLYISTGYQSMEELLFLLERMIKSYRLHNEREEMTEQEFDVVNARFQELQLVTIEEREIKEALAASEDSRALFLLTEIGKLIMEAKEGAMGSSEKDEKHIINLEKAKNVLDNAIGSSEKLKDTSQHFDKIRKDLIAQEEKAESDLAEKHEKESGNTLAWLWWFLIWLGVGVAIILGLVAVLS
ncbi:unnamed protein product [Penicillium manginii]